jgi:hypothetical protein
MQAQQVRGKSGGSGVTAIFVKINEDVGGKRRLKVHDTEVALGSTWEATVLKHLQHGMTELLSFFRLDVATSAAQFLKINLEGALGRGTFEQSRDVSSLSENSRGGYANAIHTAVRTALSNA